MKKQKSENVRTENAKRQYAQIINAKRARPGKILSAGKRAGENKIELLRINYKVAARECMRALGAYILRLFYPPRCPICDAMIGIGQDGCCEYCVDSLPWVSGTRCMKCGRQLVDVRAEYCSDCKKVRHFFDEGAAAFTYSGHMRDSVYRMKFQNRRDYMPFFAGAMAQVLADHLAQWQPDVILPVPMHPHKRRRRGYNQSELLAEELARFTGIPVKKDILRCVRLTEDQKKLDRRARRKNLRGSFAVERRFSEFRRVLLVDDIYTTGSTMDELSRVLKLYGVQQVYFIVLCIGKEKKTVCTASKLCYTECDEKRKERAK